MFGVWVSSATGEGQGVRQDGGRTGLHRKAGHATPRHATPRHGRPCGAAECALCPAGHGALLGFNKDQNVSTQAFGVQGGVS